jgi:hypothetical protein
MVGTAPGPPRTAACHDPESSFCDPHAVAMAPVPSVAIIVRRPMRGGTFAMKSFPDV